MKVDKFYIIRHGETYSNLNRVYMNDSQLTQRGINQAKLVADKIYNAKNQLNLRTIISSTLSKAIDTASIINEKLNLPYIKTHDLCELQTGCLEGTTYHEFNINNNWFDWINGKIERIADKAESYQEFNARIKNGLDFALQHDNPLIVCHGGVISVLQRILQSINTIDAENAVLYCFENTSIGWRVVEVFDEKMF